MRTKIQVINCFLKSTVTVFISFFVKKILNYDS